MDQVPTPLFWLKLLHRVESECIKGPPITCSKSSLCSKSSYLNLLGYAMAQVKVKCCMVCVCVCVWVCVCVCVCVYAVCVHVYVLCELLCVWTMGPVDLKFLWYVNLGQALFWESPLFRCM